MRKRSKYRPRGVNPVAHLVAMQGARVLSAEDALIRADHVALSVEDIAKGTATPDQWRALFDAINMAEQWCVMRVADGREAITHAQEVVEAVLDRQKSTGTRAIKADELKALRDFAADYAALLSGVTHQEYYRAQVAVETKLRRVLSGERISAKFLNDGAHQ